STRIAAADILWRIEKHTDALSVLTEALKSEFDANRLSAAKTLGSLGPDARPAVLALAELLKDKPYNVPATAAGALGAIGPEAKDAVPALIQALKVDYFYTRQASAEALGRIGTLAKTAVPVLITVALEDADGRVRKAAVEALQRIDPKAATEAG